MTVCVSPADRGRSWRRPFLTVIASLVMLVGTIAPATAATSRAVDKTPPGPVTALTVSVVSSTSLQLTWVNPTAADLAGVMIRRAVGSTAPATVKAGTLVAKVAKPGTTFTNVGLKAATRYSYSVFAYDAVPNYSTATKKTATTAAADKTPPGPVTALSATASSTSVTLAWTDPTATDFAGVMIRRAVGATAPATVKAGTLVASVAAPGTGYVDSGLKVSTKYSYSVFAFDHAPNYSAAAKRTVTTQAVATTGWQKTANIEPADVSSNGNLGASTASTPGYFATGDMLGHVYVYAGSGSTWTLQTEITRALSGGFSYSLDLSMSGDYLAIGDSGPAANGGSSGAVLIYHRSGSAWTLMQTIADPVANDGFANVTLNGTSLFVGAYTASYSGFTDAGLVYYYQLVGSTWTAEQTIEPPTPGSSALFAQSAFDGQTLVTQWLNASGVARVTLYTQVAGSWTPGQTIVDPTGSHQSFFGSAAAVSGSQLMLAEDTFGSSSGIVYTYTNSGGTWTPAGNIASPTGDFSFFGITVQLDGSNSFIVGAPQAGANEDGRAYVYQLVAGSWALSATLAPSATGAECGSSVALSGDAAVVGCIYQGNVLQGEDFVFTNVH